MKRCEVGLRLEAEIIKELCGRWAGRLEIPGLIEDGVMAGL